jgi:microcystin-dependent protein
MMNRLRNLLSVCLLLLIPTLLHPSNALAGCSIGALPFNLQNNTLADATQVMANFNQIVTGVQTDCAAAGTNNDITTLNALTTPITPTQGGSIVFNGGSSSGTNALTITTVPNFSLVTGYRVSFIAGSSSVGGTIITANVSSTGSINVYRKTQFGASATGGGELVAGAPYEMVYNGTQFVLDGEMQIVGELRAFGGTTVPNGWLLADGSNYLQTTYPTLFQAIGQTYGGTTGTFNAPDSRGRVATGLDSYASYGSGAGAAGRLTSTAQGCGTAFTSVGVTCSNGSQSHTQIVAELALHNHTASSSSSSSDGAGHTHGFTTGSGNTGFWTQPTGGNTTLGGGTTSTEGDTFSINTAHVSITTTTSTTVNNNGSSQPMPIVPNNLGQLLIIRY